MRKDDNMILSLALLLAGNMCITRTTPNLSEARWSELDIKINQAIGSLHHDLGTNQTSSEVAGNEFGKILAEFLNSEEEFEEVEKEFFERKESTSVEEARVLKRELRKKANKKGASPEDKANWLKAVKLYAFLLKVQKEKEGAGEIRRQENAYRKNFYKFSKEACNGTLGKEKEQPEFSQETANEYFKAKYSRPAEIDTRKLDWFVPVLPPTQPYNQSAIRPGQVKAILCSKAPNTSPGEDGLLYGILAKLPSVHHFLATLYSKTNESCLARPRGPPVWWCWPTRRGTRQIRPCSA